MGRDLAAAHWTWDDVCGALPLDQFISFVLYASPGTATFHVLNEGWEATTHKVADLIEWVKMLIAVNTSEPEKVFRELSSDASRPGTEPEPERQHITIGEYMKLAGLEGGDSDSVDR